MTEIVRLDQYTPENYTPGAPFWRQIFWFFLGSRIVESRLLPISAIKVSVLRWFGAEIGKGVNIKPGVRVKFPWRLAIGDHCWIGEDVWFDNIAPITLESQVCVSQAVYFCTGNHDWGDVRFNLKASAIYVETGSWLAARSSIAPGVRVGRGAILSLGSVAVRSLAPMMIYSGNPAIATKPRKVNQPLSTVLKAEQNATG
jgi:putative colanic acid biosynthesis acetyltransferase WcaF